jgi:type I restriction enzyme S subunit
MNPVQQLLTDHIGLWTGADTAKKSGRGRASGSAGTVYGIKKLRELILELAVRGKLVPQDPNDEPASALLKRIQAEKAKLAVEGKIKKDKPLAKITEKEQTFKLPKQWTWVKLTDLLALVTDGDHQAPPKAESGVPFLVIGNLNTGNVLLKGCRFVPEKYYEKLDWGKKPNKNDILYTVTGSYGIPIKVDISDQFCVQRHVAILKTNKSTPVTYLVYLLKSKYALQYATDIATGIAQKTVPLTGLRMMPIAMPPESEQHRIVAKVDELMALCDQLEAGHADATDAHEKLVSHLLATLTGSQDSADFSAGWQRIAVHFDMLFTTEASIDALKQALLQLAVMGKLVPQDPSDEPASALLERIQAEKAKLIRDGKIKKDKPMAAITGDEKPFELPQGWEWVRFDFVANTRLGKMLDQAKNKGIYRPYLRNTNVQWLTFELDDLKEMRFEEHELDEYRVISGDLVICEGGEPGRCAIWTGEIEEMFIQKALHRARPWAGISSNFLQLCFSVDAANGYLNQFFTGATIKHFSGEKLASYPIPIPSTSEQHRIVAKVDELMALCDRMKERIADAGALQRKLADVMVAQAVA